MSPSPARTATQRAALSTPSGVGGACALWGGARGQRRERDLRRAVLLDHVEHRLERAQTPLGVEVEAPEPEALRAARAAPVAVHERAERLEPLRDRGREALLAADAAAADATD